MESYEQLLASTRPYSAVLIVNGVVSTIIYVFTITTIALKSPKKKFCPRVKFILLSWATSGYLIALILALWQPVTVFPYSFGFSVGLLRGLSEFWNSVAYAVMMSSLMNFMICFLFFSVFQDAALTTKCRIGRFFREMPTRYAAAIYVCLWVFMSACAAGIVVKVDESCVSVSDIIAQDRQLLEPDVLEMLAAIRENEPSMHGAFLPQAGISLMHICLIVLSVTIISIFAFIIVMHIRIGREICEMEGVVRRETHDIQVQLFRTYSSTTLLLTIFYFLPLIITAACILGWLTGKCWMLSACLAMALYTPIFLSRIIYRVPAYRRHVVQMAGWLCKHGNAELLSKSSASVGTSQDVFVTSSAGKSRSPSTITNTVQIVQIQKC